MLLTSVLVSERERIFGVLGCGDSITEASVDEHKFKGIVESERH